MNARPKPCSWYTAARYSWALMPEATSQTACAQRLDRLGSRRRAGHRRPKEDRQRDVAAEDGGEQLDQLGDAPRRRDLLDLVAERFEQGRRRVHRVVVARVDRTVDRRRQCEGDPQRARLPRGRCGEGTRPAAAPRSRRPARGRRARRAARPSRRTVRVSTPSTTRKDSPSSGALEIRPRAGLSPTRPQQAAGMRIEPPPSLAWATGTMPEATAAAEPPEEPPGVRSRSQGLRAGPKRATR